MSYALFGNIHGEDGETAFVRSVIRPGDVCVDVGANVGWYATLMAERSGADGRVWAFEPHPNMARLVRASAARHPQIVVRQEAVADKAGSATLHIANDEGQSTIGDAAGVDSVTVPVVALDELDLGPVAFVKCDAEGAELAVLEGARQMNSGDRPPMWLLEWGPLTASYFGDYTIKDLADLLPQHEGFRVNSRSGRLDPPDEPTGRNLAFVPEWMRDRVAVA